MKTSLLIIILVFAGLAADHAHAQTILQKAVISNGGGTTANATTRLSYTVGETAVGVATNSTTIGRFGFWNASTLSSLVKGTGAGTIREVSIHPNPASSSINVAINLAAAGELELRIYNSAGQYISTIYNGKKTAGTHTFRADIGQLPSGMYFLAALVPQGLVQTQLNIVR